MNHVPAIADWSGEDDSDLTFKAGDLIAVTAQTDADWWFGHVIDKPTVEGAFPANHVEAVLFCVHAIADWSGDGDGDLTFKADDWIAVTAQTDADWWVGYVITPMIGVEQAVEGTFPANHVEAFDPEPKPLWSETELTVRMTKSTVVEFKRAIKVANALAATERSIPPYWRKPTTTRDEIAVEALPEDTKQLLARCLEPSDSTQLGKGRDAGGWRGIPEDRRALTLERAWRVQNVNLWRRYDAEVRSIVTKMIKNVPVERTRPISFRPEFDDATTALPGKLDYTANEHYLLHGAPKCVVRNILLNGPNERYSGANAGTMFGEGCYFAEDSAKIDQYVGEAESNDADFALRDLLYPKDGDHPQGRGGVYYALLCRVALGAHVVTKDGQSCAEPGATANGGLWATGRRKELGLIAGATTPTEYHSLLAETGGAIARFREFIIFNGARAYPEYLLAYSRSG